MGTKTETFHMAMYPWFAMGHLTSFLHLSNKLAERGHRISFFIPTKTISKLEHFNLYPNLITFVPVTVPDLAGLPPGAETTADVPYPSHSLLMTAMDLTKPMIEAFLQQFKPSFVFLDFTQWLPSMARRLGIKSIFYCTVSSAAMGYLLSPAREGKLSAADLMEPPMGFPPSIQLYAHEACGLSRETIKEYGSGLSFIERLSISLNDSDAIGFKSCCEMEGPYCDYIKNQFKKPIILAGPVVPGPPSSPLKERWVKWLDGFEARTVIFCAFGSECVLSKDQFQELMMGFELTGLPFLAALKPPSGVESIESALPEGFQERTKGRGVVYGGWIQQPQILAHSSVGCFVSHCGSGSLSEALVAECQVVLLPNVGDQIINARLMGRDLKVGVEVEKGDDGMFSKDGVCKAIRSLLDTDSEVGKEVRANHNKWREFLLSEGLENSYIDGFIQKLQLLLA